MRLEQYDSAKHGVFDSVFAADATMEDKDFSFVFHNPTDKAIMAMTIRWTWTDADGHEITHDFQSDGFFLSAAAVLDAKDLALIAPGIILPSKLAGRGYIAPHKNPLYIAELRKAANIKASLDTIIYSDGEVVGPDLSDTAKSITARKEVINNFRQMIHTVSSDVQFRERLTAISNQRPVRGDHVQTWSVRIAQVLATADNPSLVLDRMDNLHVTLKPANK